MKKEKNIFKMFWVGMKKIFIGIIIVVGIVIWAVLLFGGLFFLLIHADEFIARREGHVKQGDPCFESYYVGKGPAYRIKGDRVCMEFKRGVDIAYAKTLEGADVETFHEINIFYFADKNHVYYGDKILEGVDPEKFEEGGQYGNYFKGVKGYKP